MAAKIVNLKPKQRSFDEPVQFSFWEIDDRRLTNTIALWDVAPRGVFRHSDDLRDGKSLRLIQRSFVYAGGVYKVILTPARFVSGSGDVEKYPGEREQLVEEVIRQIAVQRNRLALQGDKGDVGVSFTIYEVQKELERTGHAFSHVEIVEALNILHMSRVEIIRLVDDGSGKPKERVVSGTTFPMLVWANRSSAEAQTTVSFNWLVSQALMALSFRQMDYETLMRMPGPIERWLYRAINHDVFFSRNNQPLHIMLATEIIDGCGMTRRKRLRDSLRRVSEALAWLKTEGLIADFTTRDILDGQRKVDVEYTVTPTQSLADQMAKSNQIAEDNMVQFRAITGTEPGVAVPNDPEKRLKLRRLKTQRVADGSGKIKSLKEDAVG